MPEPNYALLRGFDLTVRQKHKSLWMAAVYMEAPTKSVILTYGRTEAHALRNLWSIVRYLPTGTLH